MPDSAGSTLSFERCRWLCPAVFTAHAMEDVPRLAEWMSTSPWFETVRRMQLTVALILLIGLSCLSAHTARLGSRLGIHFFIWVQSLIFLHGMAHLIPSLWLLEYTPGGVTGVILIPFSLYVLRWARRERRVSRKMFSVVFILAVFLYDPVLRVVFEVGSWVSKPQPNEFKPGSRSQPVG